MKAEIGIGGWEANWLGVGRNLAWMELAAVFSDIEMNCVICYPSSPYLSTSLHTGNETDKSCELYHTRSACPRTPSRMQQVSHKSALRTSILRRQCDYGITRVLSQ